jgi:hypothetical protein
MAIDAEEVGASAFDSDQACKAAGGQGKEGSNIMVDDVIGVVEGLCMSSNAK